MNLLTLKAKIQKKDARMAVIGMGYVGLPVAVTFAEAGYDVLGVEVKPDRVDKINIGISPIEGKEPGLPELLKKVVSSHKLRATTDYNELSDRDIILIDVETPVDETNIPQYHALKESIKGLGKVIQPGALVIIESTIAPGTMQNVVLPLLEQSSGLKLNTGFFLGNCPERVMPGKLISNLKNLSRVVGGGNIETAETMVLLYQAVVNADLDLADWITAELVKTTENAYRDVQIAFANEIALICEAVGADIWKVRELVNKSPYRMMHLPGAGVGGHCIPKDPWLLAYGVKGMNVPLRLIPSAREINDQMHYHMTELLKAGLTEAGLLLSDARILIMGYAYLENADDTRNSPSKALEKHLTSYGTDILIHDPYVPEHQGDLWASMKASDAAVVMVAHSDYKALELSEIKAALRSPVLIDGRHVFDASEAKAAGLIYKGIGQADLKKII